MNEDRTWGRKSPFNMLTSLIVAGLFIGMSLSVMVGVPTAATEAPEALAPMGDVAALASHDPIRVNDSIELAAVASSGDGSYDDPYLIEGWDIDAQGGPYGIYIANISDNTFFAVRNCVISNVNGSTSVSDIDGCGICIADVSLSGYLFTSSFWVEDCIITGCMWGIKLLRTDWGMVRNNEIVDSGHVGMIVALGSVGNRIVSNTVTGTANVALNIYNSDINYVMRNHVLENLNIGVQVSGSDDCVLIGNRIESNVGYGLYVVSGSTSCLISANTFIDNNGAGTDYSGDHVQAMDSTGGNDWSSDYDGYDIGNYWSDLNSTSWSNDTMQDPYAIAGAGGSEDPYPSAIEVNSVPMEFHSVSDSSLTIFVYGLEGNGSNDNPVLIEDLIINAQGAGSGLMFKDLANDVDPYDFLVTGCEVYNALDSSLEGMGAGILLNDTGVSTGVFVYDGSITVEDCIVEGCDYGMIVSECFDVLVTATSLRDNSVSGMWVNSSGFVSIESCDISGNGGFGSGTGLHIMESAFINVEDTTCNDNSGFSFVSGVTADGILIEGSGLVILENVVANSNHATYTPLMPPLASTYAYGYGLRMLDCSGIFVNGSMFAGNYAVNNGATTSDQAQGCGVYAWMSNNIEITECEMYWNGGMDSYRSYGSGVYLYDCDSSLVEECFIFSNDPVSNSGGYAHSYAIRLSMCGEIEVFDTIVVSNNPIGTTNYSYGIHMSNTVLCTIVGNTVSSNGFGTTSIGIYAGSFSSENLFFGNTVSNHLDQGMIVYSGSTDNTIFGNAFYDNNGVTSSYNPSVVQAKDYDTGNDWNSTDYQMGNYWSDLTVPDVNGDLIVDVPYELELGNAQDQFPLTLASAHPSMRIDSDAELDEIAENEFWEGSGTVDDPYIMEGYTISGAYDGPALYIGNTTKYLIISDCDFSRAYSGGTPTYYFNGAGVLLYNDGNIVVEDCLMTYSMYGAYLWGCSYCSLEGNEMCYMDGGNTMSANWGYGIYVRDGWYVDVSDNYIHDIDPYKPAGYYHYAYGISVTYSNYGTVQGNTIVDLNGTVVRGMYIYESIVTVSDNLISGMGSEQSQIAIGVSLYITDNCTVQDNTIMLADTGIEIYGSEDNSIMKNSVMDCTGYGILSEGSIDNWILGNSLSDNNGAGSTYDPAHAQAYDDGTGNDWDDGYFGNLWSDLTGPDVDGDYRVDVPYQITGSASQDLNPSVLPFDNILIDGDEELLEAAAENGWTGTGSYDDPIVITDLSYNGHFGAFGLSLTNIGFHVNVTGNTLVYGNELYGGAYAGATVFCGNCSDVTIDRNILYGGAVNLALISCTSPFVSYNTMHGTDYHATYFENSEGAVVLGNQVTAENISMSCVYLADSDGSYVAYNTMTGGENCLVLADMTDGCIIMSNLFQDAVTYGVVIDGGISNVIVLNAFYGCNGGGVQAIDNGASNLWSIITTGNFWNDTTGPDANNDDIVDTPYAIDGAAAVSDLMPLANEVARPYDLGATLGEGYLYLEWSASNYSLFASATYTVYRSVDGGAFSSVASGLDAIAYNDTDVTPGHDYEYYIVATNDRVDSHDSDVLSVAIPDVDPPAIQITSPVNGTITADNDVTVTWQAWDNQSGLSTFEVSIDDGDWSDVGLVTEYEFIGLSVGWHNVSVRATDNVGLSTTATVAFAVDSAPTLVITSPEEGAIIANDTVTVTWQAWDNDTGLSTLQVCIDGGEWTDLGPDADQYTFEGLDEAVHTVGVRAIDTIGVNTTAWVDFTVGYDPTVIILQPTEGEAIHQPNVTVIWTMQGTGTEIASVEIMVDGGDWISLDPSNVSHTFDLEVGNHTVTVRVIDGIGLQANATVDFVTEDRPMVSILSPTDGSYLANSTVTVEWEGEAAYHGIDHYEIRIDDGNWTDVGLVTQNTFTDLSDGPHTVDVKVVCAYGHNATGSVSFTVDTNAPEVTAHVPTGDDVDLDTAIEVTFSEAMNTSSVSVTVSGGVTGTVAWDGNTMVFTPSIDLSMDQTYTVEVEGSDLAGNAMTPYEWSFTTTDIVEAQLSGTVLDDQGEPIEGATVTCSEGTTKITDSGGNWSMEVMPGNYTITISKDGYDDLEFDIEVDSGDVEEFVKTLNPVSDDGGFDVMILVIIAVLVVGGIAGFMFLRKKKD